MSIEDNLIYGKVVTIKHNDIGVGSLLIPRVANKSDIALGVNRDALVGETGGWKFDVLPKSNEIESAFGDKEKGEASDAFKRAGFKVGIGVELYTPIFIYVPLKDKDGVDNYKSRYDEKKGKYGTYTKQ